MAQNIPHQDDKYARESFRWRQMMPGQLWAITIVAVVVVIAAVFYGASM